MFYRCSAWLHCGGKSGQHRAPLWAVLLLLGVGLTMPRWALNVFEVGLEEGYNIPALTLLFTLLWFGDSAGRARLPWVLTVGGRRNTSSKNPRAASWFTGAAAARCVRASHA